MAATPETILTTCPRDCYSGCGIVGSGATGVTAHGSGDCVHRRASD